MNLHALRLFREVARRGSVSQAAIELNISQPAVTMQIHKLEQELQFDLTRPQGRGLVLTEAGMWLAAQAERLFMLEQDIEAQCEIYRNGTGGQLKLAATYLPANFMLPQWIAGFHQAIPQVGISVFSGNAQTVLNKLLNYEADIAWIGGQISFPASIHAVPCYQDELWFVASVKHRLANCTSTLADIARETFIMREQGSFTRDALFTLYRAAGITPPQSTIQFDGPQETIRAALQGIGIIYASKMEVEAYINDGLLAQIKTAEPAMTNPISRCVRVDDPLPPQAATFLEHLPD